MRKTSQELMELAGIVTKRSRGLRSRAPESKLVTLPKPLPRRKQFQKSQKKTSSASRSKKIWIGSTNCKKNKKTMHRKKNEE